MSLATALLSLFLAAAVTSVNLPEPFAGGLAVTDKEGKKSERSKDQSLQQDKVDESTKEDVKKPSEGKSPIIGGPQSQERPENIVQEPSVGKSSRTDSTANSSVQPDEENTNSSNQESKQQSGGGETPGGSQTTNDTTKRSGGPDGSIKDEEGGR